MRELPEWKGGDVLEISCPLKNWRFFEDPIRCKIAGEQSLPLEGQMILRCPIHFTLLNPHLRVKVYHKKAPMVIYRHYAYNIYMCVYAK